MTRQKSELYAEGQTQMEADIEGQTQMEVEGDRQKDRCRGTKT